MTDFLEKQQWKSGEEVANFLDGFFGRRGWRIEATTRHEERDLRLGDRHFTKGAVHYYVEYKSGIQTYHTGNIFLETVSVDTQAKAGWVYTCRADYIFYAALLNGKILIMQPPTLRAAIETLKTRFREVKTTKGQNETYDTHGLLVPLEYAEKHLTKQILLLDVQAEYEEQH